MRTRILGIVLTIVLATSCLFSDCAMMSVEAATNADVCITLDSDLADWDYIKKMYNSDSGRILQVAAFQTEDSIYLMRELDDMNTYGTEQLLFDTDGDKSNNYFGAEYMIQSGSLSKYEGAVPNLWDGWKAKSATIEVLLSSDKAAGEYRIPISVFGEDFNRETFGVNVCPNDTNWNVFAAYPASTSDFAQVPVYEDVYQESDSTPIENVTINLTGGGKTVQAITDPTMPGGVVGTFAAEGGDGVNYAYKLATSATYGVDNSKFKISGNQLIVGDTMLSPGSYSIYVKVTSDIRSVKVPVRFTVSSASASAVITENVFAGMNGQWFAVNHNAANSIPTLKSMKAVTDGTNLYAYVDASSLSHNAAFYIATTDSTEGANIDTWSDSTNVKYKVDMGGVLYEYNGDWQSVGNVTIYKEETGAEISVPLSMIGNVGEQKVICVGVKDGETCFLPNKGMPMYQVVTPILSDMPAINFDGNPEDWAQIQPLAGGTDTVGDLYAVHDDNYLYVMTYLSDVTEEDWTANRALSANLVINGDGDSSTGFQHEAFPQGSGADFLLQDWETVGGEERNGAAKSVEFFYSKDGSGWSDLAKQNADRVYKKFSDLGNGLYCIEYRVPISEMKAATPTASDDIYLAVHRSTSIIGLKGGTKAGGTDSQAFVFVPKYKTSVPVSVTDNAFGDWSSVARKATNTSTDSTSNLFATRSDDRLYTLVTCDKGGLNTVNTYYISTDDNTGYSISGFEKIDYIVKDAKLFKMVADNTMSEALDDVWMSYYNNNIEMQLYLKQIDNPETIKIVWRGASGTMQIPADNEMLNVTAKFEMKRDAGYYYPTEDFAAFTNPYKGWAIWGLPDETINDWDNDYYYFDSDLIYIGLTWKDLQPNSEDEFLLEEFLDKYNIREWVARGKRINLRFMMDNTDYMGVSSSDWAKGEEYVKNLVETDLKWKRMDIPMWLYEELVDYAVSNGGSADDAGIFYWDPDGTTLGIGYDQGGFAPNYYSPKLLERHAEIIQKIADYFDNTSITGHVMVGSLGHWGEFHVWPEGSGIWPTVDILDKYQEHYTNAFKNVKIGIRKPYPHAAANGYGLFNDIFGSDVDWGIGGTRDFYNYFMNGNTDMGASTDWNGMINGGAGTAEQIEASKMPEFWKTSWSGGEFANGQIRVHVTNDTSKDGTRGIMGCLDETRYCHVSWMGPCSPSNFYAGEIDAALYDANVHAMLKLMGYNFALEKINQLTEIVKGQDTALSMVWNNQGVAPFYYNWPLEFSLIDASGNVAYTQAVDGNITSWLPGRHSVNVKINVPGTLAAGNYTLAVAILDKDSLVPGIKLAIDGAREDMRYPLYTVAVTGEDVPGGDVPGGDVPGGDVPGGDVPGGDDSGNGGNSGNGGSTGGNTSGGSTSGGSTSGGSNSGSSDSGKTETTTPVKKPGKAPGLVADATTTDVVNSAQLKKALADAEDGASLTVNMESESVVSASVLETIAKKNAEVTFVMDNGAEWTVNGADITGEDLADINLEVIMDTENIPADVAEAIVGENSSVQFTVANDGEFGFTAKLTVPVGAENSGKVVELYSYDEELGEMVVVGTYTVGADGTAEFDIAAGADYMVVFNDAVAEDNVEDNAGAESDTEAETTAPEDDAQEEEPADNAASDAVEEGGNNSLWIIIAIIALVLIAAGVCVYRFVFMQKGENGDE